MTLSKTTHSKFVPNSYDWLKLAAIITMIIGHFGRFFEPDIDMYRGIGRMAMPLFLFLVGYSGKYGISKNLLFLGLAVTFYKYAIGFDFYAANILITIFCARWLLAIISANNWAFSYRKAFITIALLGASFYGLNYGPLGFMFALIGAYMRFVPKHYLRHWVLLGALVAEYILQTYDHHHTATYHALFLVVSVALFFAFRAFYIRTLDTGIRPINQLVLWISRHTLAISSLHYVLFATISRIFVITEGETPLLEWLRML
jgi:hypothetical protein